MKDSGKGLKLNPYWPFWSVHFGFHIIIGLMASIAGLVVIFTQGEVLNGLALVGAGSFAIINGWQGFIELRDSTVNKQYLHSNQNNR